MEASETPRAQPGPHIVAQCKYIVVQVPQMRAWGTADAPHPGRNDGRKNKTLSPSTQRFRLRRTPQNDVHGSRPLRRTAWVQGSAHSGGVERAVTKIAPVAVRVPSSPYQEVFLFACGENGCRVTGRDWALERCSLVGCWVSRRVASRADRPHAFTRTQWKGSFSTFPMQDAHLPFIPQQYTKYSMCTWPNRCNSWWEAATPRLESGRFAMHLVPFPFFPSGFGGPRL